MRAKDYKDGHGWCCAHMDDRHKCVNFKLVELTYNCCKYMLVSGECDGGENGYIGRRIREERGRDRVMPEMLQFGDGHTSRCSWSLYTLWMETGEIS